MSQEKVSNLSKRFEFLIKYILSLRIDLLIILVENLVLL